MMKTVSMNRHFDEMSIHGRFYFLLIQYNAKTYYLLFACFVLVELMFSTKLTAYKSFIHSGVEIY